MLKNVKFVAITCSSQALSIPRLVFGPEPRPTLSQAQLAGERETYCKYSSPSMPLACQSRRLWHLRCQSPTEIPTYENECHP